MPVQHKSSCRCPECVLAQRAQEHAHRSASQLARQFLARAEKEIRKNLRAEVVASTTGRWLRFRPNSDQSPWHFVIYATTQKDGTKLAVTHCQRNRSNKLNKLNKLGKHALVLPAPTAGEPVCVPCQAGFSRKHQVPVQPEPRDARMVPAESATTNPEGGYPGASRDQYGRLPASHPGPERPKATQPVVAPPTWNRSGPPLEQSDPEPTGCSPVPRSQRETAAQARHSTTAVTPHRVSAPVTPG